jgi:hypothetical protein
VAAFFGVSADPKLLAAAVERSSAERMRGMEAQQADQWVTTKSRRSDIPFVRTAAHGLWQEKLPASSVAEIEAAWGPLMAGLGYEPSSSAPHDDQPSMFPNLSTKSVGAIR